LKKSRLYLGLGWQKRGVVFGIIAAIISTQPVSARVLMGGGTHAQNFDSLANSGTANPQTDHVTLSDPCGTVSTSLAPSPARLRPPSVILWCATTGLSQRLPDFPPSRPPGSNPFAAGLHGKAARSFFLKDRRKSNLPSN
jgi:hypothetical protein